MTEESDKLAALKAKFPSLKFAEPTGRWMNGPRPDPKGPKKKTMKTRWTKS